ncbi:hypothetical protein P8605_30725 [Streptomyces sp. T-3]|nr:hypothetical protein [Streptomyces sp. T-3]
MLTRAPLPGTGTRPGVQAYGRTGVRAYGPTAPDPEVGSTSPLQPQPTPIHVAGTSALYVAGKAALKSHSGPAVRPPPTLKQLLKHRQESY